MKHLFLVFLSTLLASVGSHSSAQEIKASGPHPRLFFTPEVIAKLQERIKTEPTTAQAWSNMLANAKTIEELCLAYRMTGEKRYADRVRGAMGRLEWGDPMLMRRDPPWHSGLGTGRSCYEAAVAFDSIYDALTPEERTIIAKGIVDRGILPTLNDWVLGEKRIHTLDSMGHNWWSACVFDAGMATLAVMDEEPRAQDWLKRLSDASVEWLEFGGSVLDNKPKSFDAGGGFYEGAGYGDFAASQYLLFRLAWNHAIAAPASPEVPVVEKIADFFMDVSYPNSGEMMSLNFGDAQIHSNAMTRQLALLWANGYRKPHYLWYLNKFFNEGEDRLKARQSPLDLVYFPSDAELASRPGASGLPPSALYGDMGWAMLRSSWDKNATLLGVKSGFTWNHVHADASSFILFHNGENLLIDSGNCSYERPEYNAYYRQSQAHNVVLFNGAAENPEDTYFGSKFPGTVSHLMDAGDLKYVLADATGPTSHLFIRNYRNFLWIGDVILIIDDLKTFEAGQFEWLLHVDGTAKQQGLDLEVTKGAAKVLVRPLFPAPFSDVGYPADFPEKMRLVEKTGLQEHHPDTKMAYYAFAAPEQTRRTKFITAVLLVDETNKAKLPQLERLEGPDYIGVRVRQGGITTDVYLNLLADGRIMHRNANLKVNGWETDAYLSAITFPDGSDMTNPDAASRYFIAQGSYLRRDDKVVLDSLSKVFLTASQQGRKLEVLLQGQPVIRAHLRAGSEPEEVSLNGKSVKPPYDKAAQTLLISEPHQ